MAVIFDAHVHLNDEFDLERAILAAKRNLSALDTAGSCPFQVLMLAERAGQNLFGRVKGGTKVLAGCTVRGVSGALLLERNPDPAFFLIPGRQVRCERRLEVLALCTEDLIADGTPIEGAVTAVIDAGGLPVLPWGFGKWLGKRGKEVAKCIEAHADQILLADSALRPRGAPESFIFSLAHRRGVPVLAGTDPLPLAGDEERIGAFATVYDGAFDPTRPIEEMRRILSGRSPHAFTIAGGRLPLWRVLSRVGLKMAL